MLNKIIIPAALVATIVIAGIFAFMPVEKASTVHGSLTNTVTGLDRAYYFKFNQSYASAAISTGLTLLPAQAGVTYSGNYVITATANNRTATGLNGDFSAFKCGLVDGTSALTTNATGGSPQSGTLANLAAGDAIKMQIIEN